MSDYAEYIEVCEMECADQSEEYSNYATLEGCETDYASYSSICYDGGQGMFNAAEVFCPLDLLINIF